MISQYMFHKIRDLHRQNVSNRQIAKLLGIDRKTVADYLKIKAPPQYSARKRGRTRLDPFADFDGLAASLLAAAPKLTAAELFIAAKEHSYTGSIRTVARRMPDIKAKVPKSEYSDEVSCLW